MVAMSVGVGAEVTTIALDVDVACGAASVTARSGVAIAVAVAIKVGTGVCTGVAPSVADGVITGVVVGVEGGQYTSTER